MLLKKVTALVTAFAFTTSTYAMNMQELFDSVNAQATSATRPCCKARR